MKQLIRMGNLGAVGVCQVQAEQKEVRLDPKFVCLSCPRPVTRSPWATSHVLVLAWRQVCDKYYGGLAPATGWL